MDIALAVENIVYGAVYHGSVTDNTKKAWDAVVWQDKRRGKPTWEELEAAAPDPIEEARAAKLAQIDAETSAAILAGFDYAVDGQTLHFDYDAHSQQNFADDANLARLSLEAFPGAPESIACKAWKTGGDARERVSLSLAPSAFLDLYINGAIAHREAQRAKGDARKSKARKAKTLKGIEGA